MQKFLFLVTFAWILSETGPKIKVSSQIMQIFPNALWGIQMTVQNYWENGLHFDFLNLIISVILPQILLIFGQITENTVLHR